MRAAGRSAIRVLFGLLLAAPLLGTGARAAGRHPDIPEPPEPPSPPDVSISGFNVRAGETHKGNVVKIAPSSSIEGTLDGDMYVTSPEVRISGVVTGDVFVAGSQIDVSGKIEKSFRGAAGNIVIDGTIEGNVLATGGNFILGSNGHVKGNVSAYTGQFTNHGTIDGSLTFTGGTANLGGKINEDAIITADAIGIEPGAHIDGDVTYSTRRQMTAELKAITGGDVVYDENAVREKKHRKSDDGDLRPTKFGVGTWIAFFTASFLFGCAMLAVFRDQEPKVTAAISSDGLRCAGIGFVSVLVTIGLCLSMILLITIPFVVIYLVAYVIALYLGKIPVAVWLGQVVLKRLRPASGIYAALLVGLVLLYLIFMIPFLGVVAQCLVALLGLGAVTSIYLAHREARRAAAAAASSTAA